MGLRTRLTEALGITVPILSAPMGFVAGGKLAAAVTAAGGLGIYGDADWLDREFDAADVLPKIDYPVRTSEKQPRP
jgi:nitronate monooxygenase